MPPSRVMPSSQSRSGSVKDLVTGFAKSDNSVIAYKARTMLLDEDPISRSALPLRRKIRKSDMARRLLMGRNRDGTKPLNPYRKWQGPHWTLYSLALIEYPPGDSELLPLRDQLYDWLLSKQHMEFPRSLVIEGQEDRVRRCASQEGNAIWYSMKLGLVDERTEDIVDRLIGLQWPDGGWNCDKRPEARNSSFQETLIPLRALSIYGKEFKNRRALATAGRAAELLLDRRLLWRRSNGELIRPDWGGDFSKTQYPIQFYDVLSSLKVMAEIGKIRDPRCNDAVDLLASKQLPDSGFPLELKNAKTSDTVVSRGSYADWGVAGKRRSNPFVSIEALWVLREAGRLRG